MNASGLRQQPRFACEECRRRKARCDRAQPQCGLCTETGTACVIIDKRPQRGPKKGQLNMMRSQIAMLESQLGKQSGNREPNAMSADTSIDTNPNPTVPPPAPAMTGEIMTDLEQSLHPSIDDVSESYFAQIPWWAESDPTSASSDAAGVGGLSAWAERQDVDNSLMESDTMSMTLAKHLELWDTTPPLMLGDFEFADLMRADLDQLYFDRVHPVCPMIHQRRYFAWAGQDNLSPARACLRSAMRTMAAAVSAQYRGVGDMLYAETQRLLDTQCPTPSPDSPRLGSNDRIPLEHIQAWLLLAHYESLRMDERRAMITAGRAFRLVQMARLYDVDATDDGPPGTADCEPDERYAEAEERRRTFWVAFTFDRFLCARNEWPLTLQEEMVCTRLPAPETNFQNSQRVRVGFLSQVMAQSGPSMLSAFAECVVLATLHGRCMAHRRAATKESGKDARGFWLRHESLAAAVEKRVLLLRQSQTSVSAVERDPMLLFAHLLAHSAIIYLSGTIQRTPWLTAEPQPQLMASAYEQRAARAAAEMVRLAKAMPALSCFSAHPFLPNPLAFARTFLITHASLNEGGEASVEHLLRLLRKLSDINCLARELLSTGDICCGLRLLH